MTKHDYVNHLKRVIEYIESEKIPDNNFEEFEIPFIYHKLIIERLQSVEEKIDAIGKCCTETKNNYLHFLTIPGEEPKTIKHIKNWIMSRI